jgi:hypothetical protein
MAYAINAPDERSSVIKMLLGRIFGLRAFFWRAIAAGIALATFLKRRLTRDGVKMNFSATEKLV